MNRSVITIATGKQLYINLAINLARSFFWWHTDGNIKFILVTDLALSLPADLANKIEIQQVNTDDVGIGFSSKLYLDKLAPEGQTLFIDSDCLIFDKLDFVFDRFKGHAVSVIGNYIAKGEWFGDIENVCYKFNVPHIPKFNGGIYYIEKGEAAAAVYEKARELEKSYDEIGFVRLRKKPNDEVLMALAMQLDQQHPITDDQTIMSDMQTFGKYLINVITGKRWLTNLSASQKISPVVVHFLGDFTTHYPYKLNAFRLKNIFNNSPIFMTELRGLLGIKLPAILKSTAKNAFRPLYHSIWGYRKIKQSERV